MGGGAAAAHGQTTSSRGTSGSGSGGAGGGRGSVQVVPDSEIDLINNMPTVSTDGGIPDGRKIKGFLYNYSRANDVIIICFCHGSFFTPSEFVMHAGGPAPVENPMKLITIVPPTPTSHPQPPPPPPPPSTNN